MIEDVIEVKEPPDEREELIRLILSLTEEEAREVLFRYSALKD